MSDFFSILLWWFVLQSVFKLVHAICDMVKFLHRDVKFGCFGYSKNDSVSLLLANVNVVCTIHITGGGTVVT